MKKATKTLSFLLSLIIVLSSVCALSVSTASVSALSAPVIKSFQNVSNGTKITWGRVSGATKYRVFVRSGSKWIKLGDTTAVSFTNKKVKAGAAYTYTVRCINAKTHAYTSSFRPGKTYRFIAAPKITSFSNTSSGTKVTWSKSAGAVKYKLFVRSGTEWKHLGATTGTSLVHTGAVSGKTYTYTVRCVSSNGKTFLSAYNTAGWKHKYVKPATVNYKANYNKLWNYVWNNATVYKTWIGYPRTKSNQRQRVLSGDYTTSGGGKMSVVFSAIENGDLKVELHDRFIRNYLSCKVSFLLYTSDLTKMNDVDCQIYTNGERSSRLNNRLNLKINTFTGSNLGSYTWWYNKYVDSNQMRISFPSTYKTGMYYFDRFTRSKLNLTIKDLGFVKMITTP